MAGALLHGPRYARGERALRAQAMELLELVGLAQDGDTPAAALPFGKQRRLEVARALATGPACCCWTNRRRDCAPPRSKGSTTSCCACAASAACPSW